MTAPTPERLRALADRETWRLTAYESEMRTALRAAADQLEAVRQYADANYSASTVARQIVRMMKRASDD